MGQVVTFVEEQRPGESTRGLQWMLCELVTNGQKAAARYVASGRSSGRAIGLVFVTVSIDDPDFELLIGNVGSATQKGFRQIDRRFQDYEGVRNETEELREQHTRSDGVVGIPRVTGGGSLALLDWIRVTIEQDLFFDYRVEPGEESRTIFRIASFGRRDYQETPNQSLQGHPDGRPRAQR